MQTEQSLFRNVCVCIDICMHACSNIFLKIMDLGEGKEGYMKGFGGATGTGEIV